MTIRFLARSMGALSFVVLGGATFLPLGCGSSSKSGLVATDGGAIPTPADDAGGGDETDAGFIDGGGVLNDADIDAGFGCTTTPKGPGPLRRTCRAATTNECDGFSEDPNAPNGASGNGFDDDCDGLVDEGCTCGSPGTTKDCYLVPPSQTNNVSKKPVGWCEQNAKGSVACIRQGEFTVWGGTCRGAQPPFATDKCARGDFDCDGEDQNPVGVDCSCKSDLVQCPSAPFVTAPYPSPSALPLKIDAKDWLVDPNLLSQTSGWKWTLRGGDCDNIAPNPSFALFPTAVGSGTPPGSVVSNIGSSGREKGRQVTQAGGVTNVVYPAFSLSGDYILDMEVTVQGQPYKCSSKIEVRAPGLRAEACWDTMGNTDVDLHMVKVDGFGGSCPVLGWSDTCGSQDCYFANCKSGSFSSMSRWASDTPASNCVGWGSSASGSACPNPRLDRDNISCTTTQTNPNAPSGFCGSENINIDNPPDGSSYAIATVLYGSGGSPTRPHVNVYCNGKRIVSAGYDPISGQQFPVLATSGGNNGDMWKFGLVSVTNGANGIDCTVETTRSQVPDPTTDGSNSFCVDRTVTNSTKWLTPSGTRPLDAGVVCFH
jgi:hypothetical protein